MLFSQQRPLLRSASRCMCTCSSSTTGRSTNQPVRTPSCNRITRISSTSVSHLEQRLSTRCGELHAAGTVVRRHWLEQWTAWCTQRLTQSVCICKQMKSLCTGRTGVLWLSTSMPQRVTKQLGSARDRCTPTWDHCFPSCTTLSGRCTACTMYCAAASKGTRRFTSRKPDVDGVPVEVCAHVMACVRCRNASCCTAASSCELFLHEVQPPACISHRALLNYAWPAPNLCHSIMHFITASRHGRMPGHLLHPARTSTYHFRLLLCHCLHYSSA
jgi:hypothetical protein